MLKKLVCSVSFYVFLCAVMGNHAYAQSDNFLSPEFWKTASLADVQEELKNGADVNARDEEGWTPLLFASLFNANQEILEVLIKNGADVKARDKDGETAFDHALDNKDIYNTSIYWKMKELIDK